MKLEDIRELSATALSLKKCEEYEDGSTQNKWLSFFFDSAWRAHAYVRAEEAFGRLFWASSKVNLGIITEFTSDSLLTINHHLLLN